MVLSIVNLKGGVGKSTVSQNMAVYFATEDVKVCIVDTDFEQQTSMKWVEQRGDRQPRVPVFAITEKALSSNLAELKENYQLIIIDGTPALSTLASRVLLESDLVIVPITPTGFDLWSFGFSKTWNSGSSIRNCNFQNYDGVFYALPIAKK